jgi:inositol transporter-like SP family MFS transporter
VSTGLRLNSSDAHPRQLHSGSWKITILAGLANYIDGGSIVAGSAALPLWSEQFHLSSRYLGFLAAFSANAIAAAVGAMIGGYCCDRFGRKVIYQVDMIVYAVGTLWLIFAFKPWMIAAGVVIVGLAVGADIPASWSLIAESAPAGRRAAHSGVAQVLWTAGPLIVSLLSVIAAPFGVLGIRFVFAHLAILAIVLSMCRYSMSESPMWLAARSAAKAHKNSMRGLLSPRYLIALTFLIGMYGIWNLCAGTLGFFFPYMLRSVAGLTQFTAMALQTGGYLVGIGSLIFGFMRVADKFDQRIILGLAICIQMLAVAILASVPLTLGVVVCFLSLTALSGFGSPQAFYQLWSSELFPTLLRGSAQGLTFATVRIGLGVWSWYVPRLIVTHFPTLLWILVAFLFLGGAIGVIWAPRNEGKSLAEIEGGNAIP